MWFGEIITHSMSLGTFTLKTKNYPRLLILGQFLVLSVKVSEHVVTNTRAFLVTIQVETQTLRFGGSDELYISVFLV